MISFEHLIKDSLGLHARPAGLLVKLLSSMDVKVTIAVNGKSADAKRLFALMGLQAKCGDTLKFECDGVDETKSADSIKELFETNNF